MSTYINSDNFAGFYIYFLTRTTHTYYAVQHSTVQYIKATYTYLLEIDGCLLSNARAS